MLVTLVPVRMAEEMLRTVAVLGTCFSVFIQVQANTYFEQPLYS